MWECGNLPSEQPNSSLFSELWWFDCASSVLPVTRGDQEETFPLRLWCLVWLIFPFCSLVNFFGLSLSMDWIWNFSRVSVTRDAWLRLRKKEINCRSYNQDCLWTQAEVLHPVFPSPSLDFHEVTPSSDYLHIFLCIGFVPVSRILEVAVSLVCHSAWGHCFKAFVCI